MPTPYAVLNVRPADGDAGIRARFHELSQTQHPDARLYIRGAKAGEPGPLWFAISKAYSQIKTAALRTGLERVTASLSGLCPTCQGVGVTGGQLSGVKLCAACAGEGRLKAPSSPFKASKGAKRASG